MAAIELRGVTKRFGDVTALRSLDLTVEEGEVFGFLGPNGAGKSTTIDVLLDYVRPTDGEARVFGVDPQREPERVRERLGVLPDATRAYGDLTARHHLRFAVRSREADTDVDALLDRVGLAGAADRRVAGFSKGMGQRLMLAMALVGDPDLLVLDEPTTGLDPNGAREVREVVREENGRGTTVFFSSHVLEQVEAVCDRVGIVADGRLVVEDSIEGLRRETGAQATVRVRLDRVTDAAVEAVRALGVDDVRVDGDVVAARCPDERKVEVIDALRTDGAAVLDIETGETSLEDLFATYTGQAPAGRGNARATAGGGDGSGATPRTGDAGRDGGPGSGGSG